MSGLTRAIEEKLEAEQDAQRMEFVKEAQRQEAQRRIIEAEGERDSQIIAAEGAKRTMEIEAVGNLIVVQVNGVETVRFENDQFASGHVALQFGAGGSLQFRNVTVEAL